MNKIMLEIIIEGKKIGKDNQVFLIAEAGVNHNGNLDLAKKMIDLAAEAKVDAIKFQSFKTENVLLETTEKVEYQKYSQNDEETFFEMAKKYEFSKEEFKILKEYCLEKEIIFLSTPYGDISVEWLNELDVSAYKISSGDMNNYSLLELICSKNKPILLSTGMASLKEVKETIEFLELKNRKEIVIFQCTTNYPSNYNELNLNVIETFQKEFPDYIIGFSDHSLGIISSIAAVAKGAKIIEKHFTLDKNMEGPDHKASLSPSELFEWVKGIKKIESALGSFDKFPLEVELEIAKIARKSIVSAIDIKKGTKLNRENITVKRPGSGIGPNHFFELIGKKVKRDISKNSILKWDDIE